MKLGETRSDPRKIHRCELCIWASGDTRLFFPGGGADASLDLENSGVNRCIENLDYRALSPGNLEIIGDFFAEALT